MRVLHRSPLIDEPEAPPFSHEDFNFMESFQFMMKRRLRRQFHGIYPGPSKILEFLAHLVWAYVLVVLLLAGVAVPDSEQTAVRSAILILCALFAVLFIAQQLRSRLSLLMVYCAVLAHATYFAITDDAGLFDFRSSTRAAHPGRATALLVLGIAEVLIATVYVLVYRVYPALLIDGWINSAKWFNVRRGRRANTIVYKAMSNPSPWVELKQYTIQYSGDVDENFRPHGYGVWKDSSYHGEVLAGLWEHGLPIGPFTSREHGSGYASQQVRVAYASCRPEAPAKKVWNPKFPESRTLQWGVASAECSVAGGFFKFLPLVNYFSQVNPKSAADCAKSLRTLENIVFVDTETNEVAGDHSLCVGKLSDTLQPVVIPGHRQPEALVYVHGINNSLEEGITSCAKLLCMGDFPCEIHPFVFTWPSGSVPVPYYWKTRQNADSDVVAAALAQCVASILSAGYTKVHFVTHSMGARVFLNTVERDSFKQLFRTAAQPTAVATLESVTLCSPEFPLARFVRAGGAFDVLRKFCPLITIYGDKWDVALRTSEFTNRDYQVCGARVKSLGCSVSSVMRDESFVVADTRVTSAGEFDASAKPVPLPSIQQVPDLPRATAVSVFRRYGSTPDYDDEAGDSNDAKPRIYLDVDVVDTSFTDTNVGNRHSYYRVNESIVEDIRATIVDKKRARARAGLMRQRGNAYIFITAPKDIQVV